MGGRNQKREANGNWKGGTITRPDNRVMIHVPDHPKASPTGYVFRYRLILEDHLGRVLMDHEIVHHINGDPSDDRIENLKVTTFSDHMKHHNTSRKRGTNGRFI